MAINRTWIDGVIRDVQSSTTANGKPFLKAELHHRDYAGENELYQVIAFGREAEEIQKKVRDGYHVTIEGRLRLKILNGLRDVSIVATHVEAYKNKEVVTVGGEA